MMRATCGMVVVALGVAVAPAAAQGVEADSLRPGRSIALSLHGGTAVGVWMRASEAMDVGVTVGVDVGNDADDDEELEFRYRTVSVEPAVKLFAPAAGAFRPYTYAGVEARYLSNSTEQPGSTTEVRQWGLGANLAVGADWHPVRRVSLGGHVGVGAGWRSSTSDYDPGTRTEADGWTFGTLSSGIRVHLYL